MHLRIPHSGLGLKLSNPKLGHIEAALHIRVKQIPSTDSGIEWIHVVAIFSFLVLDKPLLQCWEENLGLKLPYHAATLEKKVCTLHIYRLCGIPTGSDTYSRSAEFAAEGHHIIDYR